MIVAELPFSEFLSLIRERGKEQGFLLLVIFIAREADCPHIFRQLERAWASLHDVTGKEILFSTIDGTDHLPVKKVGERTYHYESSNKAGSILGAGGSVMYSPKIRLLQSLRTDDRPVGRSPRGEWIESVIKPTRRETGWRDEQTLGISSLLDP